MTNGTGTKSVPKDFLFENFLRQKFHKDKFEKILYYDVCIIVKNGKQYGKIIICDDSIYYFIDGLNTFNLATLFKDIYSVEMINDIPDFVFGYMKNKNIHIQVKFYKRSIPIKKDVAMEMPMCCAAPGRRKTHKSLNHSTKSQTNDLTNTNTNNSSFITTDQLIKSQAETEQLVEDSIDFYILNLHSAAFPLLKRARMDYLIRKTLSSSLSTNTKAIYLSQALVNRLFDDLLLDMTTNQNSVTVLREYLLELLESGVRYTRIKILFWSKPNLFTFMVTQLVVECNQLLAIDTQSNMTLSHDVVQRTTYSYLNVINVLLEVFNTFCVETDHLTTKLYQLRQDNGKVALSLIGTILSLIAYLNDVDRNSTVELDQSAVDVDIDCLKHSITVSSIQLFYQMICSSEVPVSDLDDDPFSIRTIARLLESLISYDSSDGVFNKFVNHSLQMQFIWIFPTMFKFDDRIVSAEQVVTIYRFFSSLRTMVHCVPKFSKLFRQEMKEEFEHFQLNDGSFPHEFPLSALTLKLLKSFQKNMINSTDIFIDYY